MLVLHDGPFNGGPDNRPAKLDYVCVDEAHDFKLQWRAGQLSGQTEVVDLDAGAVAGPSMEGRAIARPNARAMMS